MSAVYIALLLVLIAVSSAVLLHVRGLSRRFDELRAAASTDAPASAPVDEAAIRRAVTDALAADREREINEARAFWAEQEARAAEDEPLLDTPFTGAGGEPGIGLSGLGSLHGLGPAESWPVFFPRPIGPQDAADSAGTMDPEFGEALRSALEDLINDSGSLPSTGPGGLGGPGGHPSAAPTGGLPGDGTGGPGGTGGTGEARARREADLLATGLDAGLLDVDPAVEAEPVAAPDPRRHPSHPDFVPSQTPSREWTDTKLTSLAEDGVALTDVRPGPLGTLDVYAFADGTTLCVAPGDREAAYRLIDAVRAGEDVRLLGGSRFSGSYSLTFSTDEEAVYVLADRVVASI
ncbi:hypothetical protein P3T36_001381 [Kitasatospora sp. MAP12-15]|uniref:hypothetical protein n=1 Tax=unclassified Kitasatospora TaxID=2633591 RepID=UPI002474675B|nr:hypothetical protein [Kitasatospora sp. MAP12-44]MDH6112498.1 hypothetical protein [Kitasatospora sp. MAP12-44]